MTEPQAPATTLAPDTSLLPSLDEIAEMSVDQLRAARKRCRLLFHPNLVGLMFRLGFAFIFFAIQIWAVINDQPAVSGFIGFILLIVTCLFLNRTRHALREVAVARRAVDAALTQKGTSHA